MSPLKLLVVAGARPNFMKVAPFLRAAKSKEASDGVALDCYLVHTGQHYDATMSEVFFAELRIPQPDINLDVGSGSHAVQTAKIMERFDAVCEAQRPDWIVVFGDVNSTLACTLVGAKRGIKVAHVEAGLRSFDRSMPEEINRIVTDCVADLLLTPSEDASGNLLAEGIPADKIGLVGNIMIDALVDNIGRAERRGTLSTLELSEGQFAYVTLHRPSNVDEKRSLSAIVDELSRISYELPVVFPMHPRTRQMFHNFGITLPASNGFRILDPLGYHDSINLTKHARLVLTDSGGLQEESTFFRTPCLTLRPNTERPVTVDVGSNRLTSLETLGSDIAEVLLSSERIGCVPPLWDGHAAERCVAEIAAYSA